MYSQRFALSLEVILQLLSGFFNLTRCCHLSATACLLYHTVNRLSTTFFIFLLLLSKRLFAFRFRFAISLISISRVDCFVNNFFRLFLNCFNNSENMSIKRAEKEGFEPSRRY